MHIKTVLFVVAALVGGVTVMAVSLFSGALSYNMNAVPGGQVDIPALAKAIACGFITYMLCLAPMKVIAYRTMGFKLTFVLFFVIPVMVFMFWSSIGPTLSLYILLAIAALESYQALVVHTRAAPPKR